MYYDFYHICTELRHTRKKKNTYKNKKLLCDFIKSDTEIEKIANSNFENDRNILKIKLSKQENMERQIDFFFLLTQYKKEKRLRIR